MVIVAAVSAATLEAARLVVDAEEWSRLALLSVTITVVDCERVIDPSNGSSSTHANGKSGFSVAIPQADAEITMLMISLHFRLPWRRMLEL